MDFKQTIWIVILTAIGTAIFSSFFSYFFSCINENRKLKIDKALNDLKYLYFDLYSIIAQSEYLRKFHNIQGSFKDYPFLEVSENKTTTNIINGGTKKEKIDNSITSFNKLSLDNKIIDNKEYACAKLIKLAIAYRYLHKNYLDNTIESNLLDKFQEAEVNCIYNIVTEIVKETNKKMKICKIDYDKNEMKKGQIIIE